MGIRNFLIFNSQGAWLGTMLDCHACCGCGHVMVDVAMDVNVGFQLHLVTDLDLEKRQPPKTRAIIERLLSPQEKIEEFRASA